MGEYDNIYNNTVPLIREHNAQRDFRKVFGQSIGRGINNDWSSNTCAIRFLSNGRGWYFASNYSERDFASSVSCYIGIYFGRF